MCCYDHSNDIWLLVEPLLILWLQGPTGDLVDLPGSSRLWPVRTCKIFLEVVVVVGVARLVAPSSFFVSKPTILVPVKLRRPSCSVLLRTSCKVDWLIDWIHDQARVGFASPKWEFPLTLTCGDSKIGPEPRPFRLRSPPRSFWSWI